jgi:transposase
MKKKYTVQLKKKERNQLKQLLKKGKASARKLNRCHTLLQANEGKTDEQICDSLDMGLATIANIRRRYHQEGLKAAINEKPRSGAPKKFSGKEKAKITAIACSAPPEGRSRWTLRLLADHVVALDIVDEISFKNVSNILKKTNLSLT